MDLDPFRELCFETLDRLDDALAHLQYVVAFLLVGGDEHRTLTVEAPNVAPRLRFPSDVGKVAHAHDTALARGDDGIAHLIERGVTARGLQAEATRAQVQHASRDICVLALDRLDDWRGCDAELRHLLRVRLVA